MNNVMRAILPSGALTTATKRHAERRILRTSPTHLLRIISDVDSYSQFLPLCNSSRVLRRSECGTMFDAALTVGLPLTLLKEDYVSRVTVDDELMTVTAESIRSSGMFDSLRSRWKLRPVPAGEGGAAAAAAATADGPRTRNDNDGEEEEEEEEKWCDVEFEVEMSVSDPIVVNALDRVLQEVAGRQVTAFEKRCGEIPAEPERRR